MNSCVFPLHTCCCSHVVVASDLRTAVLKLLPQDRIPPDMLASARGNGGKPIVRVATHPFCILLPCTWLAFPVLVTANGGWVDATGLALTCLALDCDESGLAAAGMGRSNYWCFDDDDFEHMFPADGPPQVKGACTHTQA